jgi:hypothetical protein
MGEDTDINSIDRNVRICQAGAGSLKNTIQSRFSI